MLINIAEEIRQQASNIASTMMPEASITSYEKEMKKKAGNFVMRTRFFAIIDDLSAEEYSTFITEIIKNPDKYKLIREAENWTKEGELIRVVDFLEESPEGD